MAQADHAELTSRAGKARRDCLGRGQGVCCFAHKFIAASAFLYSARARFGP